MNNRIRKKYRGCRCAHLHHERFEVTNDPQPYYEIEEYCKIKDPVILGVDYYENGYCLQCRHLRPNMKEERDLRDHAKAAKHGNFSKREMELFEKFLQSLKL